MWDRQSIADMAAFEQAMQTIAASRLSRGRYLCAAARRPRALKEDDCEIS